MVCRHTDKDRAEGEGGMCKTRGATSAQSAPAHKSVPTCTHGRHTTQQYAPSRGAQLPNKEGEAHRHRVRGRGGAAGTAGLTRGGGGGRRGGEEKAAVGRAGCQSGSQLCDGLGIESLAGFGGCVLPLRFLCTNLICDVIDLLLQISELLGDVHVHRCMMGGVLEESAKKPNHFKIKIVVR